MKNNRKGQAAMEFLMTYGWAILAAIVVIAVLAIYFKPSTLVSSATFVTAPLKAVSESVNQSTVRLEIKNQGGELLTLNQFTVTVKTPTGATCPATTGLAQALADGAQTILAVNGCTGLTAGQSFNADIAIEYTVAGSTLPKRSTGTIASSITAA